MMSLLYYFIRRLSIEVQKTTYISLHLLYQYCLLKAERTAKITFLQVFSTQQKAVQLLLRAF